MHTACMATKTISIDLKAYERLRQARQTPEESFSRVIHRAKWRPGQRSCGDLLDDLERKRLYISAKEIGRLERAQAQDTPPPSHWG